MHEIIRHCTTIFFFLFLAGMHTVPKQHHDYFGATLWSWDNLLMSIKPHMVIATFFGRCFDEMSLFEVSHPLCWPSVHKAFLISKLCITQVHAPLPIFLVPDCSVMTLNGKPITVPPSQQKEIELYFACLCWFPLSQITYFSTICRAA